MRHEICFEASALRFLFMKPVCSLPEKYAILNTSYSKAFR